MSASGHIHRRLVDVELDEMGRCDAGRPSEVAQDDKGVGARRDHERRGRGRRRAIERGVEALEPHAVQEHRVAAQERALGPDGRLRDSRKSLRLWALHNTKTRIRRK